ncbi:hypothetical protein KEJ43_06655, partial [Candidatus Bathyarchaeota archaeon]|nr:hypothetical protein [Candidatus Bathyarchaeota archaeon]
AKDLKEEDWSRFLTEIQDIGGDSRRFADELLRWLYNAEDPLKIEQAVLEVTPRLADLSAGELENMGRALAKVGDSFENGVKLFDTYFKIPDSYKSYGIEAVKEISNVFLENVEKDGIKALEAWVSTLEYSEKYQVLVVPASIKEIEIGGEIRRYPVFPKTIVDATGMKSEGNIITIFVSKDGEAYNILGELGGLKSSEGVEVYPVYPQEVLQREGRFADVFGLSKGDYVIVSKGAVEPDFFFFTEKAKGEKVKVKLTSIWGEKFIEAHGFREYFLYYRRIGEQGLHHAIKGFEDEGELGKYITLLSHGEGLYVLRLEPVAWDMFFGIIKSVKEEKLKIPISYEPDPSTGKGRITIEIEDSLTRGLRKTLASGVYEYAPYLRVGEIEGGLKWDIPLGEAGGQMKALRIGLAVDDSGNLYYDVEYSPDYDPENLGGTHWFPVEEVVYVNKPFGTVMEIHHEGGTRHLLFDSSSGLFKGEFIGPRDSEYEALSKYIRDALSNSKISGPFYDSEEKVWRIRIEAPEIFREAWAYGDSLLSSHGKGTLSTEIVRDFPMKRYPEHFGNVDPNKIEVDMTGQNLEEYWFDMLERDWTAKKLFFIGEAKSEWREWRPYSMLKYATDDLIKHVESVKSWKLPMKGYVFAIYMGLEIEIWWQEVDLSSIGK